MSSLNLNLERLKVVLTAAARSGDRIVYNGLDASGPSRIWPGLGNRAGLHSFQFELIDEKWKKSGERFLRKLDRLGPGGFDVLEYVAHRTQRGRGSWVVVARYIYDANGGK